MKLPYSFKIGSLTVEIVSGNEKPVERFLCYVFCIGIFLFFISGCSTLAQIGEIEGLGKTGEILRAAESSRIVLGGTPYRRDVAPVVNRKVGEINQLDDIHDIPNMIQSLKYIAK